MRRNRLKYHWPKNPQGKGFLRGFLRTGKQPGKNPSSQHSSTPGFWFERIHSAENCPYRLGCIVHKDKFFHRRGA